MLIAGIITISLALVFYTTGVWGEKLGGGLKNWNLICFWFGIVFDTTGTTIMSFISGKFTPSFHSLTGLLAIILMLVHALWATVIMIRKDEKAKISFHKFSIFVWIVWLIPYLAGVVIGISKAKS